MQQKVEIKAVGAEITIDPIAWLKLNNLYLIEIGIDFVRITAPGIVKKGRVADVKNSNTKARFTIIDGKEMVFMILDDEEVQSLNPNGADRVINLPEEEFSSGFTYKIINSGMVNNLIIKNANITTIIRIAE
jgi:hypothetical protein